MPELKPCPFCGKKAKVSNGWTGSVWCECSDDDCPAILQDTEEDAIAAWNTRPEEDRIRRETIEECITIISQNTPMEGCDGCETRLYEKLRALTPDSDKVLVDAERLREIEWAASSQKSGGGFACTCPACGGWLADEHFQHCWLGNILKTAGEGGENA